MRTIKKIPPSLERDINQVVATNLLTILGGASPETWQKRADVFYVSGPKKGKKVSARKLRDLLSCINSPSLDVIAAIAEAEQLHPYQLLFPDLDPSDAPVLLSRSQQQVINSIREKAQLLK